ncbi:MAG: LLM class F420-dependent oxidoreductase [Alphaproteobacteria bacterium]|nr:LLM class F420-dependent oxidoreductase [Alphaproteobacteria bacterium]
MHVGVLMFITDYALPVTQLARALEDRGFESLWIPEHSHIPISRKSQYPAGGDLPKRYYDCMDPFPVIGAAAAATTTLKVATGICVVSQRDPIQTAKSVATVDRLSGGRFLFGTGVGWNRDEMENHGTDFKTRLSLTKERIEAMKRIWTQSKAEYHGRFVDFDPMMTWPKPVQTPHPPVLMGGGWPHAAKRALEYGDGWMPNSVRPTYHILDKVKEWEAMKKEYGRDVPLTCCLAEDDIEQWGRYRDAGVARIIVEVQPETADKVLPKLDALAQGLARVA